MVVGPRAAGKKLSRQTNKSPSDRDRAPSGIEAVGQRDSVRPAATFYRGTKEISGRSVAKSSRDLKSLKSEPCEAPKEEKLSGHHMEPSVMGDRLGKTAATMTGRMFSTVVTRSPAAQKKRDGCVEAPGMTSGTQLTNLLSVSQWKKSGTYDCRHIESSRNNVEAHCGPGSGGVAKDLPRDRIITMGDVWAMANALRRLPRGEKARRVNRLTKDIRSFKQGKSPRVLLPLIRLDAATAEETSPANSGDRIAEDELAWLERKTVDHTAGRLTVQGLGKALQLRHRKDYATDTGPE